MATSNPLPPKPAVVTLRQRVRGDLKRIARKFIPKPVLRARETYYHLSPEAQKIYLRLKLWGRVNAGLASRRKVAKDAHSILFVCHGNIMRSPVAAALLKRRLAEQGVSEDSIVVGSAGLHASDGREAHEWAQAAAAEIGISLAEHFAKRVTPEMVAEADAILVMDFENKAEMLALYPEAAEKLVMLSAYGGRDCRYGELEDPFHDDLAATRKCFANVNTCVRNLTASLCEERNISAANPGEPVMSSGTGEDRNNQR